MRYLVLILTLTFLHQANAAELVLLSSVGARAAVERLAPEFEKEGHHLTIRYDTAAALKQAIDQGTPFDVALLTSNVSSELTIEKHIAAADHRVFAYAKVGLAIKTGSPTQDISSKDAFTKTLLSADKISFARDGASGRYFKKLIAQLGLEDQLANKLLPMTGAKEIEAVAEGQATLGVQLVSEILPVKGVTLLGKFPAELQNVTELDLDISDSTPNAYAAKELVRFLSSAQAKSVIANVGLDTP
ncbi:molybdate transport system substrate-binding protein [Bradyrhizobium sp. USDA 4461]